MKKTSTYFLIICIFSLFASCKKNPFVPEERIKEIRDSLAALKSIQNICFIYNNDVYFLDEISKIPQQITSTPSVTKTKLSISHNLQKIAYINTAGNPEIVDRNGTVIATLTSLSGIKQMDWSSDDATLYMLIGNSFYYYGPAMTHPSLTLFSVPVGSLILSASLSMNNDLAYVVEYFHPIDGYVQKLILKKNDGTNTELLIDNVHFLYDMRYVKFSVNEKDLILGYSDFSSATYYNKMEVFTDMKTYPDMEIPLGSNCSSKYPVYRSDKKCLVSAYSSNNSWSSPGEFVLSAYFVNDITFKNKDFYDNTTSDLIVDWK